MFRKIISAIAVSLLLPGTVSAVDYHTRVSSFVPGNNGAVFSGESLRDGNYYTGWIEQGFGNGTGEWLYFFFPSKVVVDSITVRNGIGSGDDFRKVNRVKGVRLSYSEGQRQQYVLEDTEELQKMETRSPPTNSLGLYITSVYTGDSADHAGISEVVIEHHRPTPDETVAFARQAARKKTADSLRKMSSDERKVLSEKMGKLERKKAVLEELKGFFDRFYSNFVTINEEYPHMFTEDNFMRESAVFENFRSMLKRRGVLQKYQEAVVSTSGLRFTIRTLTPTDVELWVKGEYTVIFDLRSNQVTENALFHLRKEYGEWKVKNKLEY